MNFALSTNVPLVYCLIFVQGKDKHDGDVVVSDLKQLIDL